MAFTGFPQKLSLVRTLLEERTKRSLFGRLLKLNYVDDATLIGCPEGTIATIVESYYVIREQGASHEAAVTTIEDHRSTLISGKLRSSAALEDYVRYRVRLEHRGGRQISDTDISRACFIATSVAETLIAKDRLSKQQPDQSTEHIADFVFISELPHRESNRPLGTFKSDEITLVYYEYPKSNGAVVAEIVSPYKHPQVVVVYGGERALLIIRIEENPSGALFLCSMDAKGNRENWGSVSRMSRNEFVKKAGEVLMQIKYGEMDVGKTVLSPLDRPENGTTAEVAAQRLAHIARLEELGEWELVLKARKGYCEICGHPLEPNQVTWICEECEKYKIE